MLYGRNDAAWDDLTRETLAFLVERARLGRLTSYAELNATLAERTGHRPFEFERETELAAFAHLLDSIVRRTFPETGLLLSALVTYLDANDAGPDFFKLAQTLGLLHERPTPDEKFMFWVKQVHALYAHYG